MTRHLAVTVDGHHAWPEPQHTSPADYFWRTFQALDSLGQPVWVNPKHVIRVYETAPDPWENQ